MTHLVFESAQVQHQRTQEQVHAPEETSGNFGSPAGRYGTVNSTPTSCHHAYDLAASSLSASSQPSLCQLDGPQDYRPRMTPLTLPVSTNASREPPVNPRHQTPKSAYHDLLPYCTAETPLNEQQVIGLSDIAGSLKEVMLLALRARTDERFARELAMVVGVDGVRGIVDFFADEFEI